MKVFYSRDSERVGHYSHQDFGAKMSDQLRHRLYTYKAKVTSKAIFLLIIIIFFQLFMNSSLPLPIPSNKYLGGRVGERVDVA